MKEVQRHKLNEEEVETVLLYSGRINELQEAQKRMANTCLKIIARAVGLVPDTTHHVLKQEGDDFFLVVMAEEKAVDPDGENLPRYDM